MKNSVIYTLTNKALGFIIIGTALLFSSCEKVVDVDLKDTDSRIVIEGNIISDGNPCIVDITKTINFDKSNNFPGVNNATVILSDNVGNSESLSMISNGRYISSTIVGVEGRTYTLNVVAEGKTFTATSTLPYKVNLDSIWVDSLSFLGSQSYILTSMYTDTKDVQNYYRFKLFVNDSLDKAIFTEVDNLSDGRTVANPKFPKQEIKRGDTLRLQMMCIDKPAYMYFFSLASVQDGSSGAPANPVSNFSGGCLGYFSAHTFQEKTIVVN